MRLVIGPHAEIIELKIGNRYLLGLTYIKMNPLQDSLLIRGYQVGMNCSFGPFLLTYLFSTFIIAIHTYLTDTIKLLEPDVYRYSGHFQLQSP